MKKSIKYSIIAVVLLWSMTACELGNFGDINTDPNRPSSPNTAAMLTSSMRDIALMSSDMLGGIYAQHFGEVTYIEESRYKTLYFDFSGDVFFAYIPVYNGTLNNLQTIIALNTNADTKEKMLANGSNANQIALARILKAYCFLWITDHWGDVPYSDALKGKDNFSPKYDTQQTIYNDLFKELKEAAAQFDGGEPMHGDIILEGNIGGWKKFANSLRAVAALRLSKIDPAKGKTEFAAALSAGLLESNDDNVHYFYLKEASNAHPIFTNYITQNRRDFAVSSTLVNWLANNNDPRLSAIADPNLAGKYNGVPYGVFPPTWRAQDVSLMAASISQQDSPINIMTHAQVLLSQAEAVKLGWIAGDAKDLYEQGIRASMEQFGVHLSTDLTDYLNQPAIKYTDAKALEQIATQKWVALFFQGAEAWAEYRRTGYPLLKAPVRTFNGLTEPPRRLGYPTSEVTLNKTNLDAAIARQGPDLLSTRVWWDKK
jgi:hypothetical protein